MGPLLGHNTNVRHRGKTYHVQTEDSGVKRPHIFTHCFADGGRIVASRKASYAHLVDTPAYPDAVRELMRLEHSTLIEALTSGELDDSLALGSTGAMRADATARDETPPTDTGEDLQYRGTFRRDAAANAHHFRRTHQRRPSEVGDSSAELDIAALERAAEKLLKASPLFNPKPESLPPPLAAQTPPDQAAAPANHSLPPSRTSGEPAAAPAGPKAPVPNALRKRSRSTAGRYQSGPHQAPAAIDILPPDAPNKHASGLRQHTLDEVILAYLDEDAKNPKR